MTSRRPCESNSAGRLERREFLRLAGLSLSAALSPVVAGPFPASDADHFVPADKKLAESWVKGLFAAGDRTWYSGDALQTIGMPVGGVAAGQVYLTGDGRLTYWSVFNQDLNTGYGQASYHQGRKPTQAVTGGKIFDVPPLDQGTAVVATVDGQRHQRTLDRKGFPGVRFCGEYPIGHAEYRDDAFPLAIDLDAFSPFIPLNAVDSALPLTFLEYTLTNRAASRAEVVLGSWLENAVLRFAGAGALGDSRRRNEVRREGGAILVESSVVPLEAPEAPQRVPIVFADFEGADYAGWEVEGKAFGKGPSHGTEERQQPVSGFRGKGLVNTYQGGNDQRQGRLLSPPFQIERPWLSFLVGGGSHAGTAIQLLLDGKPVRAASGKDNEKLEPCNWQVADLMGKTVQLAIVDHDSSPWGHINIDQIEFRDTPLADSEADLRRRPDWGTMAVSIIGEGQPFAHAALPQGEAANGLSAPPGPECVDAAAGEALRGAVGTRLALAPGASARIGVLVAWHMPNRYRDSRLVGNYYGKHFADAAAVLRYALRHQQRLAAHTHRWHDVYYDSTLPHWLLDRLHAPVANLATETCQWWRNGRFWAWEGCGCCHGTCGHVWNYAHALARLFPRLERTVREMQDFAPGVGLVAETGEIRFRGEGWNRWAGDAQAGYILKAYREHQCSRDDAFLNRNWRWIRQAMSFLLACDGDEDGLIEGQQHQTYDQDYYGANTMVGSLYLGALRAAEEMASDVGDTAFAQRCRAAFEKGRTRTVERLFNGDYFIQDVDLAKHPQWQYANGCLADQLFGQSWAVQLGLGYLYPPDTVQAALKAVWRYNWAPDVGPQNKRHRPARWFASPGEAGLFICTWPKSRHLGPKSTRYRNEVWTGIEYQVASHLAWEGMLTEALAMCRAVHERYHPARHNPWNEVECGDHYSRALASWGVLIALSGFSYHGPRQHLGFAPRLGPSNFRGLFTTADGWGALEQHREPGHQTNALHVRWGSVTLRRLDLELADEAPAVRELIIGVGERRLSATVERNGTHLRLHLPQAETVGEGHPLEAQIRY